MNVTIDSPFHLDAETWTANFRGKESSEQIQTTLVYTSFALSVLCSAYTAHTRSDRWVALAASISIINLYSLPKILHHGNAELIRCALSTNLASFGGLFLGGASAALFSMSRTIISSIKTYQFSTALLASFGMTALLGYGIPLVQNALEKAHRFFFYPEEWQDNFSMLQEQFHRMPEMGLGVLQSNLWQNFILELSLLKPEFVLSFWQMLFINSPDYIWSMAAASTKKISTDQLNEMLADMLERANAVDVAGEDLPDEIVDDFQNNIRIAIKGFHQSDLKKAVSSLLMHGANLIPTILTNEQFFDLLLNDALDAANELLGEFLDFRDDWPDERKFLTDLEAEVIDLRQDIADFEQKFQAHALSANQTDQELDTFNLRHQQVTDKFKTVRDYLEKLVLYKRIWQNFAPLWKNSDNLPFERSDELLQLLSDQTLMKEIDDTYRSTFQSGNGKQTTFLDHVQSITNKLSQYKQDDADEPVSSIMHLAANRGFIQKDFEDMQEWLDLDSPNDLEDAFSSIGIGTEEDLYVHGILLKQKQNLKVDILEKLQKYIENASPPSKPSHKTTLLDDQDDVHEAYALGQKVSRVVYYAISRGMILVPMIIHPYAATSGFVIGSIVFTLKRFGVKRAIDAVDLGNDIIENIPFGQAICSLIGRKVFSMNPRSRDAANQFAESDFCSRMRIINLQMLSAIFISYMSIRLDQPYLGSFLQGSALAHEIVHLV